MTERRGEALAAFIASAADRPLPAAVQDGARRALADFLGLAVGAHDDAPVGPARRVAAAWKAAGGARAVMGSRMAPALAALINGTAAHAMDFDDTHPMGGGHPSAPCWSAALALAEDGGLAEDLALRAFVTGYEIMARLGGGGPPGVGRALQKAGFHPTSMFGRVGAAAAACVLLRLDPARIPHALGAAATMAGGLVGSFGTDGKPFHAGKAAMDGIMAAQLAAEGFVAATHLFELEGGLLGSFLQRGLPEVVPPLDFDTAWEVLNNGFKPYASCRATHPAAEAAQGLAPRIGNRDIVAVTARVHPDAMVVAGKLDPKTALEAKFSVPFCVAMGLRGRALVATDFHARVAQDPALRDLLPRIACDVVAGQVPHTASVEVVLEDGERLANTVAVMTGHPDNPMGWDSLRRKFDGLAAPVLGTEKADALFEEAHGFGTRPGGLGRISTLIAG